MGDFGKENNKNASLNGRYHKDSTNARGQTNKD